MAQKTVAILETRTGEHLAGLVARLGASPLLAPALEEVPDTDHQALAALLEGWKARPFGGAIFQTGVGTRALFQATDALGATPALLERLEGAVVAVRGPKPVGELRARGVRIDIRAASPFTTETLIEAIAAVPVDGAAVLVQSYGEANIKLREALTARGARVQELATYRWALPADTRPLEILIERLAQSSVDAVLFTSAVQVQNLHAVAARLGRGSELGGLMRPIIVGSIGPVCSRALRAHGIEPTFEADPPKLGPLIAGLEAALAAPGARLSAPPDSA
jgi:uroporphyrinogen-III synthase